jgi:ChaB
MRRTSIALHSIMPLPPMPGDPRQEEASHRIAWAAVKRAYVKVGNDWVARADSAGSMQAVIGPRGGETI